MSDRVWLITSGCYSDYGVSAVCLTKEDAELIVGRLNGSRKPYRDEYEIEERPLLSAATPLLQCRRMTVMLDKDGTPGEIEDTRWEGVDGLERVGWPVNWWWSGAAAWGPRRLSVEGYDVERVGKVFSDQKAMFMANPDHPMARGKP